MPLWKVPFDSLCISHPYLLVFPFSPNMPKRGSTEGWVQARWMKCLLQLSHQQLRCAPSRQGAKLPFDWQILQSNATGWQMASKLGFPRLPGHRTAFLKSWSPVIELLLYCFFNNNKKNNKTVFFPGIKQNCGGPGRHARTHEHLTKALIYRLNVGMSFLQAAALLSFRRHKITADNIYLKGAVEW